MRAQGFGLWYTRGGSENDLPTTFPVMQQTYEGDQALAPRFTKISSTTFNQVWTQVLVLRDDHGAEYFILSVTGILYGPEAV
jgi:hypothetical protein